MVKYEKVSLSTPQETVKTGSDDEHDNCEEHEFSFVQECLDLMSLAIPIAISRLAWVGMKTTDTALIGHTKTRYLSASAISDLWTASTGVLLQGGVLSILAAQAVGSSNKQMAGVWVQVSLFVLSILLVPVMVLWACTGPVLYAFGVKDNLIGPASYYSIVLMFALPVRVCAAQLSQYFMAQRITQPMVFCGLLALIMNLCLGVIFVLGYPIPNWEGFGFHACAVVTVLVEVFQVSVMFYRYCYLQKLHETCWPGWSWSNITKDRVWQYVVMYFPAALAGASDWWRVSVIGAVAVSFNDDTSLAVFNSSYRILWMCLIFIGSIGGALGVKVANSLGSGEVAGAKHTIVTALTISAQLLLIFVSVLLMLTAPIASIFSPDPEMINKYKECALPLAITMLTMNGSVLLERIPLVCGRTSLVFWIGVVGSWGCQVPMVLLCTKLWRNDLYGLYCGVASGYALVDLILLYFIYHTDFHYYSEQAKMRSEEATTEEKDDDDKDDEKTILSIKGNDDAVDNSGFHSHDKDQSELSTKSGVDVEMANQNTETQAAVKSKTSPSSSSSAAETTTTTTTTTSNPLLLSQSSEIDLS